MVVVLSAVFFVHYSYNPGIRAAREVTLRMGLTTVRNAVLLYQIREGRTPPGLRTLLNDAYMLPTEQGTFFSRRYLERQALDTDGFPIDPFGNRFLYDPTDGTVRSQTKGYTTW